MTTQWSSMDASPLETSQLLTQDAHDRPTPSKTNLATLVLTASDSALLRLQRPLHRETYEYRR